MIEKETLIYDIETRTPENRPNPNVDKLRVFGAYSYKTNKYYLLTDVSKIKELINNHKYFVGFNNIQYDNCVLHNSGLKDFINSNKYGDYNFKFKYNIDLMKIFLMRSGIMKTNKGMLGDLLMSYSLDYITKTLDLVNEEDGKIKNFDYSLLNKDNWTEEEKKKIAKYTKQDIVITKKLYEWVEDYFSGFKPFLNSEDIINKNYLTSTVSSFAYKVLCKELGYVEEYDNKPKHQKYGGGYVAFPAGEHFSGNIYCLDFNSLYPSIMHQCNIYSPLSYDKNVDELIDSKKYWRGNNVFDVEGYYKSDEQGQVEKLLKKWYEQRLEYKKNKDSRQYTLKIVLNTIYGLLGNENFKHFSDNTAAGDVTRLGRQWTMLARKYYRDAGYEVIYTDTDSVYVKDHLNDENKLLEVKDRVIKTIKDNVPFPYDKFDMGIDDKITDMWFFKNRTKNKQLINEISDYADEDDIKNQHLNFMKKNYIYRTEEKKIVVKNLGVRKKSTSALARKIFWDYLVPRIRDERKVKFKEDYIENLIQKLLKEDISIAATRYSVGKVEDYKNPSQLQAQISKQYGSGLHFLIRNDSIGVGKGTKYCKLNEWNDNNLTISNLDLTNVWNELQYFIEGDISHKTKRKTKKVDNAKYQKINDFF